MSLAILWLALLPLHMHWVSLASLPPQSPCEHAVIGSDEVFASKSMDVDGDGRSDTVIIHGQDELFLAIIGNSSSSECQVVLNTYVTSRVMKTGIQKVDIRAIELVEITGDEPPELHVALERSDAGGPRVQGSEHAIYILEDGTWRKIFHRDLCLAFNSFEFRDNPNGGKDIYLDEDRHCQPPWSSGRNYAVIRWDGNKFVTVDSGYKETDEDQAPWFLPMLCAFGLALILLPFAAAGALAYITLGISAFLRRRARKPAR